MNPLAEAECEELGERAAFVREQRRDLEQSSAELLELIKELTARIDADFAETFAAVQEQFEQMIAILFPDGRGRLVLVEGDEADEPGGVAVEVKPARKLGKKLQLLSGGERSLVAIAFLMALVLAGRARSTSSTRSRRRSTTSTSAASSAWCASTATARSSSSSPTRSAPWRRPTCSTA